MILRWLVVEVAGIEILEGMEDDGVAVSGGLSGIYVDVVIPIVS